MRFRLLPVHLQEIKAVTESYGEVYIHGSGNKYLTKEESDIHKKLSSPETQEAEYVAYFKKGDKLPESVEELTQIMFAAKQREDVDAVTPKEISGLKGFSLPAADQVNEAETKAAAKAKTKAAADQVNDNKNV